MNPDIKQSLSCIGFKGFQSIKKSIKYQSEMQIVIYIFFQIVHIKIMGRGF